MRRAELARELALRFDRLESTLARSLNEACALSGRESRNSSVMPDFEARISFPAFQANQLNFNTRGLFNDAIVQDSPPADQPAGAGSVRNTVSLAQ